MSLVAALRTRHKAIRETFLRADTYPRAASPFSRRMG